MLDRALMPANAGKFVIARVVRYNVVAAAPGETYVCDEASSFEGVRSFTHECIAPGAFAGGMDDVVACLNHDVSKIVGSTHDDTLNIWSETNDLRCLVNPRSAHAVSHRFMELVRCDGITGMSFRFKPTKQVFSNDGTLRTVLKARLTDVSFLTGGRSATYSGGWVRFTNPW